MLNIKELEWQMHMALADQDAERMQREIEQLKQQKQNAL